MKVHFPCCEYMIPRETKELEGGKEKERKVKKEPWGYIPVELPRFTAQTQAETPHMRTITLSGCVWLLVMLNYTSLLNYGLFPSIFVFFFTHPPVKRFDPDAAKWGLAPSRMAVVKGSMLASYLQNNKSHNSWFEGRDTFLPWKVPAWGSRFFLRLNS